MTFSEASIAAKEMLPILVAAAVWGQQWFGATVLCNCDNEAVVVILQLGSAKDKKLAHMLRCLFFLEAKFQFTIVAAHIPSAINLRADTLSHNHIDVFLPPLLRHAPLNPSTSVDIARMDQLVQYYSLTHSMLRSYSAAKKKKKTVCAILSEFEYCPYPGI